MSHRDAIALFMLQVSILSRSQFYVGHIKRLFQGGKSFNNIGQEVYDFHYGFELKILWGLFYHFF